MPLQIFPLTGGLNQQIDARLLPDGILSNAVNCELERIGRIVGRAKYTALGTSVYGNGTFVGFDLFSVDDRLFAFGDTASRGYPTDVFEYTPNGAAVWAPSNRSSAIRLPGATGLREVARPPDVSGGTSSYSAAAVGGFVLLAYNNDDPDGVDNGYLHVVIAANDQTVLFDELPASGTTVCLKLKALALSDRFIIIGTNAAADRIGARRFIPASDESSASVSTALYTGLGAITGFAACKVEGSDEFVIVANVAGTIITKRFNASGVEQVPSGGAYANITANPTRLSVYANTTDNQVVIGYEVAGALRIQSYNLTVGTTLASAVAVLAGQVVSAFFLLRFAADFALVVASGADGNTEDSVYQGTIVPSTGGSVTSSRLVVDASLISSVQLHTTSNLLFAIRYGSTATDPEVATNVLVSVPVSTPEDLRLLAVKNFESAGAPGVHLPDLTLDVSTGKYYWANSEINPDADSTPEVTEFLLNSTARRQTARFGSKVYIAGGLPLVFDTRMIAETGFTERPRIISLAGSNAAGELLSGATYNYRLHAEQVDAAGDLHLSPPSVIEEVTLTAGQDTVTAVVSTGHSLRRNRPAGFMGVSVRHVLSRTLATVSNTAAVIFGATSINPPSAALNGLTLLLTAGGSAFTVTFTGAATTQAVVLSEINTVVSSEVTATAPGGGLVLTSVDTGEGATIQITGGTANAILGLTNGQTEQGETERTVGENFQRAASAYNPTADVPGEFISVVDLRKDESDPIVDADLIRQQVLYSQGVASGAHHAPPPSDCVWAGKERVGFFRQNLRSRWTVSKLIVPAEPVECAALGFNQFSGQVSGDIEAGAFVGGALCLWTRKQIWLVTGEGPRRNGVGEFNQADCITRSIGLISDGWQSMVQDDEGVWFQGSDAEIYRIGNGGQLEWLGKPVREYLQTYPKVIGACYRQNKREVAFAVTNALGTTGGILRRNALVPESPAWFFDDVGAVSALAEVNGRLAYVQAGVVYLQDAAPGSGAFPTFTLDSGLFQGFQGLGYGALQGIGVLGTFRGRCTVTLKLGTDGTTFPNTIASWSLTSSEYAVGQRVQLLIDPPLQQYDAFAMRAEVSDVTGTTEGLWLHAFGVETENQPGFVRLAPSRRL